MTADDFDEAKAQRAVDFIETLCTHTKGRWAGQPFELLGWQDHHNDLRCDFGVEVWEAWLKLCIPESDVDGVLTLAVPTAFFRDHIDATYKEGLQKTLGRRIVIVQRGWAADANRARAYKAHLAEKEAAKKRPPDGPPGRPE